MQALIISLLFLAVAASGFGLIDLEADAQDFVVETRKIEIPGFPFAFNASIVRWQSRNLMCFREVPNLKGTFTSYLYLVWLDNQFTPVSNPQLLLTREPTSSIPSRAEDPRLLIVQDRLYLVYSDNPDLFISKKGFRVHFAEITTDDDLFVLNNIEQIIYFEGESSELREKNWVPFDYKGNLMLAYSLLPHKIFLPIMGSGECVTVATTLAPIHWDWGSLRGGTPALEDLSGEYLAFFHSSKKMETVHSEGKNILHYFMGAYTFSRNYPFAITKVSLKPIIGVDYYKGPPFKRWGTVKVIFPGGFLFDDEFIWIIYGKDDHEIWITKLDRQKLFKSLVFVSE